MTIERFAMALAIIALVMVILVAWTAIPDCNQPGVCG